VAFSGDDDAFIFVVDSETDSLYQFQSNGQEGVNPPAGADADSKKNNRFVRRRMERVQSSSMNPGGVAYYRTIVYVADTGNNRIARFKLTTDFE
jgi:sugar lactone lactonase YvrE